MYVAQPLHLLRLPCHQPAAQQTVCGNCAAISFKYSITTCCPLCQLAKHSRVQDCSVILCYKIIKAIKNRVT